jgi:predicted SAM-dependent methyltransferase
MRAAPWALRGPLVWESRREWFDEAGKFHYRDWSTKGGTIWRSSRFDRRNRDGRLRFTSIIADAVRVS